eukprot:TRINITY_DN39465_c0_g1_i3.p1 TRINITY_DN39465_c0_g1~~TRINITY_DN39465_c0_g1_i3.p1  ORF type:complete len:1281 (+),score=193.91 TRINITY_DN39465_c0_g1_i3:92-3934(+)
MHMGWRPSRTTCPAAVLAELTDSLLPEDLFPTLAALAEALDEALLAPGSPVVPREVIGRLSPRGRNVLQACGFRRSLDDGSFYLMEGVGRQELEHRKHLLDLHLPWTSRALDIDGVCLPCPQCSDAALDAVISAGMGSSEKTATTGSCSRLTSAASRDQDPLARVWGDECRQAASSSRVLAAANDDCKPTLRPRTPGRNWRLPFGGHCFRTLERSSCGVVVEGASLCRETGHLQDPSRSTVSLDDDSTVTGAGGSFFPPPVGPSASIDDPGEFPDTGLNGASSSSSTTAGTRAQQPGLRSGEGGQSGSSSSSTFPSSPQRGVTGRSDPSPPRNESPRAIQRDSPQRKEASGKAESKAQNPEEQDRLLAERLAREDGAKIVAFERFRGEDVLVDPKVVEEINSFCRERGEPYVDPQFPPLDKSLYLSSWEAEEWECQNCLVRSPLPAVPPLPRSRDEAKQQEEAFRVQAQCVSCGSPPPYVVQVKFFTRPTQWLRPGEKCPGCEMVYGHLPSGSELVPQMCTHFVRDSISHTTIGGAWKLIREAARPEDVCQGGLGNCWFAGALSVVAQLPNLIEKLFLTKEFNPWGVYYVQLCYAGEWRGIVLDDLFPTSKIFEGYLDGQMMYYSRGGTLCYLQGARRQLWVPLVEKAAAKLFGSYGSLKGGTFGEALGLFTGYPTQRIRLYVPKATRDARAKRRQVREARRAHRIAMGLHAGAFDQDSEDSDDNDDLKWSKLLSCKEAGYLMGMGCTAEGCEKTKEHIVEEMGLQAPHAYGILDLQEAVVNGETVRLLKIRNPWGERAPRTWKGDWGKDSEKWTPELQRQLGVMNSSGVRMDDPMSIFWMSFKDVKEYFSQVEICRVHVGWHEVRCRAWLPSALGPGEAFDLTVFRKTSVDITLWQEKHIAREGALGARSTNVDVGFAVMRSRKRYEPGAVTTDDTDYHLVEYCERASNDDVSCELVLEGGYVYRLVPLCFGQVLQVEPRCAVVSVHSVHPVELAKVRSSWPLVSSTLFEAARKHGNRDDHTHPGVNYYLLHEAAGCVFAVENISSKPSAVQVDVSESLGCICSRGCPGAVALLPPRTRQVVLVLAISPGALYTRVSVLPQPVPVELAPPPAEAGELHQPMAYISDAKRKESLPPPSQAIMQRAPPETTPAVSTSAAASRGQAPYREPTGMSMSAAAGAAMGSDEELDEDLLAAMRLSLETCNEAAVQGGQSASTDTPVSQKPLAALDAQPSLAERERLQVQTKAKQLFAEYRARGMPPNEAAARAGADARSATAGSSC